MYLEPIEEQPIKRKMYLEPIETPQPQQPMGMPKQPAMTLKGYGQNILSELNPKNIYQGAKDIVKSQVVEPIKNTIKFPKQMAQQVLQENLQMPAAVGGMINQAVAHPIQTLQSANRAAYDKPLPTLGKALFFGAPMVKPVGALGKAGVQAAKEYSAARIPRLQQKATSIYRNILRPTQGEIKNIEIRGNKNIDDLYKLAAEEKLPIKKSIDGRALDTEEAREAIAGKQDLIHKELSEILKTDETQHSLIDLANKAKEDLKGKYKNASEYKAAVEDVDTLIGDEIQRYGSGVVNSEQLNNIKQGMWQTGYNATRPTANKTARTIGHVLREEIERKVPNKSVKVLNNKSGQYMTLNNLLENAQGRVIAGGKLGDYFAKATGALIGSTIPIPAVGSLGGWYAGGKIAEYLRSPERLSAKGAAKMGQAQKMMSGKPIPNPVLTLEDLKKKVNSKLRDNRGAINPSGDIKPVGMPKQPVTEAGKYKTADEFVTGELTKLKSAFQDQIPKNIETLKSKGIVVNSPKDVVTMYHGTNKKGISGIEKEGLNVNSYLASDKKAAQMFARSGGDVIEIKIPVEDLGFVSPSTMAGTEGVTSITAMRLRKGADGIYRISLKENPSKPIPGIGISPKDTATNIFNKSKSSMPKQPVTEVNPLIAEARKYNTSKEFIDNVRGNASQYRPYAPQLRKNGTTEGSKRISDLGIDPELDVTIYRGVSDGNKKLTNAKIVDGDFITTDKLSAESYAGKDNVVTKKVKAKDLIHDYPDEFDTKNPFPVGAEFIYSDSKNKLIKYTDSQLTDIWNKSQSSMPKQPTPKGGK